MTAYRDIYSDLPARVHEVWQRTRAANANDASHVEDRSVTAMLMAAAAGLAMPFENLRSSQSGTKKGWNDHPAFHGIDQAQYKKSLATCKEFLKKPIDQCEGLNEGVLMQCQELRDIKPAAKTGKAHAILSNQMHDARFALGILRNALAHNNILDAPNGGGQIEKLAFFSKNNWCSDCGRMDGWHVLLISVGAFQQFLDAWFSLLKEPEAYRGAAKAFASS